MWLLDKIVDGLADGADVLFDAMNRTTESKTTTSNNSKSTYEKAMEYFEDERPSCFSDADIDTLELLYRAIKNRNETYYEDNMQDAMEVLDNNTYRYFQAILYQNFMLMRRLDYLSEKVEQLETKLDQFE